MWREMQDPSLLQSPTSRELPVGYAIAVVDMDTEVFDLASPLMEELALDPENPSTENRENNDICKQGNPCDRNIEVKSPEDLSIPVNTSMTIPFSLLF